MVSGRISDNTTRADAIRELRNEVVRPPKFERTRPLKRFELEPDVRAQLTIQNVCTIERCTYDDGAEPLLGLPDNIQLD
jgi:hypothetical protein